jgi:hypothetical protein
MEVETERDDAPGEQNGGAADMSFAGLLIRLGAVAV